MKPFKLTTESTRRRFLEKTIWKFQRDLAKSAMVLPDSLFSSLGTLQQIRMGFYEDLNQLLHAVAIVSAFEDLCRLDAKYRRLDWKWNPTQQGDSTEPDLRGAKEGKILVSAEVNTSHDPKGKIGTGLKKVCEKLGKMNGRKIFFVANEKVESFAKRFVVQSNLAVEVMSLGIHRVGDESRGRLHESI